MLGEIGSRFYAFLQELSADPDFAATTQSLAQAEIDQKGNEELVLRFFAGVNAIESFRGSVRDWLDDYMEAVLTEKVTFDLGQQGERFKRVFNAINTKLGETAFVKFRGKSPVGGLAPAYFEVVSIGAAQALDALETKDPDVIRARLIDVVQGEEFREVTGPGANNRTKLKRRIELVRANIADVA
jgi:hypothetical protein